MKNLTYEAINFNTYYTGPGVTGPSPLVRNIFIKDIDIDGVPTAINLIGLPEKWLENIYLENITVRNAEEGARISRVKNLNLKNVDLQSHERAMVASDVYEFRLENVTLSNKVSDIPLLFGGTYNGAILIGDYPADRIEFGEGMSEDILMDEDDAGQEW